MASNFLGDVQQERSISSIISTNELSAREGVNLQKGMNYRTDGDQLSVFLVLERGDGFRDGWDPATGLYEYEGHDSTTIESGKQKDQILMYEDGRLTDNGRFYKEAQSFKDGVRKEPLQVQIYEKLESGAWYDKGIFNLVDSKRVESGGRKVCRFILTLADAEFFTPDDPDVIERMLPAQTKADVWKHDQGRCVECGKEINLHLSPDLHTGELQIRCADHAGKKKKGLLG